MLRASSYNIYVDLPGNSAEMLLVHGYTGAYDKVSRRTATYLRSLESGRPSKPLYGDWSLEPTIEGRAVPPFEETVNVLKRRGYLTEKTVEEEEALFVKMVTALRQSKARRRPSYIFMLTYDCNLCCPYCYQDHLRSQPAFKHLLHTTMQPELVDRIFAAMPKLEARHAVPQDTQPSHLHISFYGGEPLLERNRSIVEYIVSKASAQSKTSFSAVTNGTDLHAFRDLLGPGKITQLQITLDGPPREHDKRRVYSDGSGSFGRIASNITLALDLGVRVNLRMNIDRTNIHQLPGLADEILSRGWNRRKNFSAYTSAVGAANEKTQVATTLSSWELDQALTEMRWRFSAMSVIQRPDDGLKNRVWRIFDQQTNPMPSFRASYCGAHTSMYIIDPFGDLYVCWERTGDPALRIGRLAKEGDVIFEADLEQTWRNRTVLSNPVCRQCRYALYCGGGCAARAISRHNEFFTNYCDGFASRFRGSAAEAYLEFVAGVKPAEYQDQGCEV